MRSPYALAVSLHAVETELAAGPPQVRVGALLPGPLRVYGVVEEWNLRAGAELARLQWQGDLTLRAKPLLARVRRLRGDSREVLWLWLRVLRELDALDRAVQRLPGGRRKAA